MRRKVQPRLRATALASMVLPVPGTSSMSKWPRHSSATRVSRTSWRLPMMTRSTLAATFSPVSWMVLMTLSSGREGCWWPANDSQSLGPVTPSPARGERRPHTTPRRGGRITVGSPFRYDVALRLTSFLTRCASHGHSTAPYGQIQDGTAPLPSRPAASPTGPSGPAAEYQQAYCRLEVLGVPSQRAFPAALGAGQQITERQWPN